MDPVQPQNPDQALEQFKARVEAEVSAVPEGAQARPFDGTKLKKLAKVLDDGAERFGPFIATLSGPQNAGLVDLVSKLLDAIDDRVNPDTAD